MGFRSIRTCKKGTPDPSVLTHKGISPPVRSPPADATGPPTCPESSRESVRPSAAKSWSFMLYGALLINEAKCAIVFGDMLLSTISGGETNHPFRSRFLKTRNCPTLLSASGGRGGGGDGTSLNALPSSTLPASPGALRDTNSKEVLLAVAPEKGGASQ